MATSVISRPEANINHPLSSPSNSPPPSDPPSPSLPLLPSSSLLSSPPYPQPDPGHVSGTPTDEEEFSAFLRGLRHSPNDPTLLGNLRDFLVGQVEKQLRAPTWVTELEEKRSQQVNSIRLLLDQKLQGLRPDPNQPVRWSLERRYGEFISRQQEMVTQQHQQLQIYLNRQKELQSGTLTSTHNTSGPRRSSNPFAAMFSLVTRRKSSDRGKALSKEKEKEKERERNATSAGPSSPTGPESPQSASPTLSSPPTIENSQSTECSAPSRSQSQGVSQGDASNEEKNVELFVESPFTELPPSELYDLFSCPSCLCLFNLPVTASCGHTYCMDCLRTCVKDCLVCGRGVITTPDGTFVNITLYKVMENYFPPHLLGLASLKAAVEESSRGNPERALELVSIAIEQYPACQLLYVHRAHWHLALGRMESAVKDALSAVALQPANGLGQLCLAEIYLRRDKLSEGLHFACQALLWNPRMPQAQSILAQAISLLISSSTLPSLADIFDHPLHWSIYDLEPPYPKLEVNPHYREEETDCECQVCFNVFLDPVTTQCGHSFCRSCVVKAIETSGRCPYCRFPLSRQRYYRKKNYDRVLAMTATMYFSLTHAERLQASITAELEERLNIPIFPCTLGFPQIRCPLHVYEPKYRVMMKRVVASGKKQFGMCGHTTGAPEYEYGTLMEIRDTRTTSEGNVLLDVFGIRRFRIKSRRVVDGYHVADIDFVEDSDSYELEEPGEIQSLVRKGKEYISALRGTYSSKMLARFDALNGPAPLDPSDFSLWLLGILPIEEPLKYFLLTSTDCIARLRNLAVAIEQLNATQFLRNHDR